MIYLYHLSRILSLKRVLQFLWTGENPLKNKKGWCIILTSVYFVTSFEHLDQKSHVGSHMLIFVFLTLLRMRLVFPESTHKRLLWNVWRILQSFVLFGIDVLILGRQINFSRQMWHYMSHLHRLVSIWFLTY